MTPCVFERLIVSFAGSNVNLTRFNVCTTKIGVKVFCRTKRAAACSTSMYRFG